MNMKKMIIIKNKMIYQTMIKSIYNKKSLPEYR